MTYWKTLGVWTVVLTAVVVVYSVVTALSLGDDVRLALAAWSVLGVAGALMPFLAFAAGVGAADGAPKELVGHLLITAALTYVLLAWVDPVLQHEHVSRRFAAGGDSALGEVLAHGPDTPGELLLRKVRILENPPDRYSFSTQEPLATPPNWIDFRLHSPLALGLFALINGLLGAVLARWRPRGGDAVHRLWLMGLLSAVGFMAPMMVAESLVRASLTASGVVAAWAASTVPLAALVVAAGLARRGRGGGVAGAEEVVSPGGGG